MDEKVALIIVGIDGWQEYTRPAINSILQHEPEAFICVVDNESKEPYPDDTPAKILHATRRPYAAAINTAIELMPDMDWYLILNNDVLCTAPFLHMLDGLLNNAVYGRQIITENGLTWLGLWLCLLPRKVYETVGTWDEQFGMCGFEDTDYCLRAAQKGFPTRFIDLPFTHLWGKTRWGLIGYENVRRENRLYFQRKHGWLPGANMAVTHE